MGLRFLTVVLVSLSCCLVNGLQDGTIYRFTSVVDGNVITVSGDKTNSGVNITAEPYQDGSNQKWLAVGTGPSADSYFLLPKRQTWSWSNFVKDSTRDRRDKLPDYTVVMSLDINSGYIAQLGYTGTKLQQWKTVDAPGGSFLIKNLSDEKCLFNPGLKPKKEAFLTKAKNKFTSLFGKKKDKKLVPSVLQTKECDPNVESQLWKSEVVV